MQTSWVPYLKAPELAHTKLMKDLDYGNNYQYAHSFKNNFVSMEFMPDEIAGTKFYDPGNNAREEELRNNLKRLWGKKYDY